MSSSDWRKNSFQIERCGRQAYTFQQKTMKLLSFDIEISDVFEFGKHEDMEKYAPFHVSVGATAIHDPAYYFGLGPGSLCRGCSPPASPNALEKQPAVYLFEHDYKKKTTDRRYAF